MSLPFHMKSATAKAKKQDKKWKKPIQVSGMIHDQGYSYAIVERDDSRTAYSLDDVPSFIRINGRVQK